MLIIIGRILGIIIITDLKIFPLQSHRNKFGANKMSKKEQILNYAQPKNPGHSYSWSIVALLFGLLGAPIAVLGSVFMPYSYVYPILSWIPATGVPLLSLAYMYFAR